MTCANCKDCPFTGAVPVDLHEIHITVNNCEVEVFKKMCELISINDGDERAGETKPVLIAIQDESNQAFTHLMTSTSYKGTEANAMLAAARIEDVFVGHGIAVSRVKIETTTANPVAQKILPGQYFEAHIQLHMPLKFFANEDNIRFMNNMHLLEYGARLSKNAFKIDNQTETRMVTYRNAVSIHDFSYHLNRLVYRLTKRYVVGKVISEFAWFDTNVDLDRNWR